MSKDVNIKWLGHACFLISYDNIKIIFDPFKDGSVPNLKFNKIDVNYLFISHEHGDHANREDVNLIYNNDFNLKYELIDIPHDHHGGTKRGQNKITIIYLDDYKIAHFGDIGCMLNNDQIEQLKDCDLILIPINGFYTISALEAYEIFKILKPKIMIPMHYFYNNSGYPDNNQINNLIKICKEKVEFCKDLEINLNDYLNKDESKILILDANKI